MVSSDVGGGLQNDASPLRQGLPWALLAGGLALLLYLSTAAETITWRHDGADSGELAVAAVTLGVPHPPGYPSYVLLGKAATLLVPVGDAAHRLALLAAAAGAGTVGLVLVAVLLASRAVGGVHPLALLIAGLSLVASPLLWSQATIAEVYALAAMAMAGGLVLLALWTRRGGRGLLAAFGLLLGLGAGLHLTVLFLAVAALPLLLVRASWRDSLAAAGGLLLGMSPFLLLPLLAARQPPIAWGDPRDLPGLLWTVTGAPYRPLVFGVPVEELSRRLWEATTLLVRQMGPLGWILAGWGAWRLWRHQQPLAIVAALLAALSVAYAVGYDSRDSFLYLLPVVLLGALSLAFGVTALLNAAAAWRPWAPTAVSLVLLAAGPGLSLLTNWGEMDLSRDRQALEYAASAAAAGEDGLIVADSEEHVFSLWYYRYVVAPEGSPDVVSSRLLQFDWYRDQVRRRRPGLLPPEPLPYEEALAAVLAQAAGRPLYLTWPDPLAAERYDLLPAGPLYRVVPREGAGG